MYSNTLNKHCMVFKNMFMSGPEFFGQFLKEREKFLICAANEANLECYTRLLVKVNVFFK